MATATVFGGLYTITPSIPRPRNVRKWRAMVEQAGQGASSPPPTYAKEMERLYAKESLLLALKDSGGLGALFSGKVTDMQRVDVNERITGLESLNPTVRPTTSPFLEGRWNFEWFGTDTPWLFAATSLFEIGYSDQGWIYKNHCHSEASELGKNHGQGAAQGFERARCCKDAVVPFHGHFDCWHGVLH